MLANPLKRPLPQEDAIAAYKRIKRAYSVLEVMTAERAPPEWPRGSSRESYDILNHAAKGFTIGA